MILVLAKGVSLEHEFSSGAASSCFGDNRSCRIAAALTLIMFVNIFEFEG